MIKLVCDIMLGKLARKLRMLGIDTAYQNNASQNDILHLSKTQNRIILTRNSAFAGTLPKSACHFIRDNSPDAQLRQVISHFKLSINRLRPFSRCICCNTELRPVTKEEVEGKVADYVFTTSDSFSSCPACGKIFWPGTHYQNMVDTIDRLLASPEKPEDRIF